MTEFLKKILKSIPSWILRLLELFALFPGLQQAFGEYILALFDTFVGTFYEFILWLLQNLPAILRKILKDFPSNLPEYNPGKYYRPRPGEKPVEQPFGKPIHHSGGRAAIVVYSFALFSCVIIDWIWPLFFSCVFDLFDPIFDWIMFCFFS